MKKPPKIEDYFILIYSPGHSRAVGNGYVPEQILVTERAIGRLLSPDEEVRHINGNPHDNRPINLEIISMLSGYKSQYVEESAENTERKKSYKEFMPCRYQRVCWKTVRAPKIKKLAAEGISIYLPYICSFQGGGDIYKCSHFWNFLEEEMKEKENIG